MTTYPSSFRTSFFRKAIQYIRPHVCPELEAAKNVVLTHFGQTFGVLQKQLGVDPKTLVDALLIHVEEFELLMTECNTAESFNKNLVTFMNRLFTHLLFLKKFYGLGYPTTKPDFNRKINLEFFTQTNGEEELKKITKEFTRQLVLLFLHQAHQQKSNGQAGSGFISKLFEPELPNSMAILKEILKDDNFLNLPHLQNSSMPEAPILDEENIFFHLADNTRIKLKDINQKVDEANLDMFALQISTGEFHNPQLARYFFIKSIVSSKSNLCEFSITQHDPTQFGGYFHMEYFYHLNNQYLGNKFSIQYPQSGSQDPYLKHGEKMLRGLGSNYKLNRVPVDYRVPVEYGTGEIIYWLDDVQVLTFTGKIDRHGKPVGNGILTIEDKGTKLQTVYKEAYLEVGDDTYSWRTKSEIICKFPPT